MAGTTEKIFEEKRDLYDVYVDNQNVKTHHEHLQPLLKINSADKEKYRRLNDQRQMLMYSQEVGEDCSSCEEDLFILFFYGAEQPHISDTDGGVSQPGQDPDS